MIFIKLKVLFEKVNKNKKKKEIEFFFLIFFLILKSFKIPAYGKENVQFPDSLDFDVWKEQHAPINTEFLPRPARKESNVPM